MPAVKPPVRYGLGTYLAFAFSLLSILVTAVLVMVSEQIAKWKKVVADAKIELD